MGAIGPQHAVPEPEVVSPSEWGAAPPRATLAARGPLDHVVVHHSAFPSSSIAGRDAEARHVREIQRWHLDRGFTTIGYHFVIAPSGRIFRGRPVDRLGAHVQGHNRGTVGICLMGDLERERPTAAALASLEFVRRRLIPGGSSVPLRGHREHRGHETNRCPGRHLLSALRPRRGRRRAASSANGRGRVWGNREVPPAPTSASGRGPRS